MSSIKINSLR